MRTVTLNAEEIAELDRQDPNSASEGGFQGLLVRLQRKLNRETGELVLDEKDLQDIPKYAFDYKQGGWQKRLVAIFGRTLGPQLGR